MEAPWIDKYEQVFQALKEHLRWLPLLSKLIEGEKLYLCLIISKEAVSASLIREKKEYSANLLCKKKTTRCWN